MLRNVLLGIALGAAFCAASGAYAADTPSTDKPVNLIINPDGTAVWDGTPLPNTPALKDKLAHRTEQTPKLELDLYFHSVGTLSDSNRQTLMDILALTAQYGYVHVDSTINGAKLTVLGPSAADAAPPK